jgi:hypothetical protein
MTPDGDAASPATSTCDSVRVSGSSDAPCRIAWTTRASAHTTVATPITIGATCGPITEVVDGSGSIMNADPR